MYKNPVHLATAFLDGQRTSFLQCVGRMKVADQLKALRLALPHIEGKPVGVRTIATAMGYPTTPNAYGYYEGATFTKDALPLDKAREIAAAFARFGGSADEVLKLAGLSEEEIAREPTLEAPPVQYVQLAVALPSSDVLATMMRGLLKGVGLDTAAAEHAETLARRLPGALAQASSDLAPRGIAPATSRGEPAQPRATHRHD